MIIAPSTFRLVLLHDQNWRHQSPGKWHNKHPLILSPGDTQGREAAFAEKRHDKTARLALDLIYYIAPIKSELSFSISRTLNNSNLPIYRYHRNQVSLSLQRAF